MDTIGNLTSFVLGWTPDRRFPPRGRTQRALPTSKTKRRVFKPAPNPGPSQLLRTCALSAERRSRATSAYPSSSTFPAHRPMEERKAGWTRLLIGKTWRLTRRHAQSEVRLALALKDPRLLREDKGWLIGLERFGVTW